MDSIRFAAQTQISQGFVFLDYLGETFTVPMETSFRDGQLFTRVAEHATNGQRRTLRFRFIR